MHPEISRFPSLYFYDGELLNGEMINRRSSFHDSRDFSPYIFYDVLDGVECRGKNSGSFSLWNVQEIDATISLLSSFKKRFTVSNHLIVDFCLNSVRNWCYLTKKNCVGIQLNLLVEGLA